MKVEAINKLRNITRTNYKNIPSIIVPFFISSKAYILDLLNNLYRKERTN